MLHIKDDLKKALRLLEHVIEKYKGLEIKELTVLHSTLLPLYIEVDKVMPNGFDDWYETHHLMVSALEQFEFIPNKYSSGERWEIAYTMTVEFENKYKDHDWGHSSVQYYDAVDFFVEDFIKKEIKG